MAAKTAKRTQRKKKPRGKPFANGHDPRRNRKGSPSADVTAAEFAAMCRAMFMERDILSVVADIAEGRDPAAKPADRNRASTMLKEWGWGAGPITVDLPSETTHGDTSPLAGLLGQLAGIAANQATKAAASQD